MEIVLPDCCPCQYWKAFPLSEPDLVEEEQTVRTGNVWLNGEHPFLWAELSGSWDRYMARLLQEFLLWVNPSDASFLCHLHTHPQIINTFLNLILLLKKPHNLYVWLPVEKNLQNLPPVSLLSWKWCSHFSSWKRTQVPCVKKHLQCWKLLVYHSPFWEQYGVNIMRISVNRSQAKKRNVKINTNNQTVTGLGQLAAVLVVSQVLLSAYFLQFRLSLSSHTISPFFKHSNAQAPGLCYTLDLLGKSPVVFECTDKRSLYGIVP